MRAAVRPQRRRARGPVAAAEHVAANDEVAPWVERPPRTKQRAPPAVDVRRAGERVADEHGVAAVLVELAPAAIGDPHGGQPGARLQGEGTREGERPRRRRERLGAHAAALTARSNACWKSALMSSMCSMPTETRTRSGVTPVAFCSASESCWCV